MIILWPSTAHRSKIFALDFVRRFWKLFLLGIIGYVFIVYPVYFLFTVNYPFNRQVSDTTQILASFAHGPTPAGQHCEPMRCLANLDIWMSGNPVLRPYAEYMLGVLMVMQRADTGNTIYFLGQVRPNGGWGYFPILFVLKEPIPTLIIVITALLLALWWMVRKRGARRERILVYLEKHFAQFSMASFIVLYWGYSMHSPLNIGIRHLMPTIPLILILASGVWKKWIMHINFSLDGPGGLLTTLTPEAMIASVRRTAHSLVYSVVKYVFLVVLVFWLLFETLFAAPYFLSYFNEFAGGTWNGYHFVTDSNYDWGQDLLRLQSFVDAHPEIDKIAVDYFGGGNPSYYLGAREVDWSSSKGNPAAQGIHWFAISINQLEGATQPLAPRSFRNASDSYSWLTTLRPTASDAASWPATGMGNVPPPDFRVGTSIFVYHL